MDVTKPYRFIWLGVVHSPKPYKFIGFRWAFISQTPVFIKEDGLGLTDVDEESGHQAQAPQGAHTMTAGSGALAAPTLCARGRCVGEGRKFEVFGYM